MSYYVQRIVTITEDSTKEKLEKLRELIYEQTDFRMKLHSDHIDDSNYNYGLGISHGPEECDWERISEKFGEIPFIVHCFTENHAIYDYDCYDGNVQEVMYRNTDEWYKHYEDKSKRAPGANEGYYDDAGYGEDYPVPYGEYGRIPAGVIWWKHDKK